mgnify:CR=1 FL=1
MRHILIEGGQKLNGRVNVSGSKNSATKVLIACVLTEGVCILENVPQIADVHSTLDILEHLGANVKRLPNNKTIINASNLNKNFIPTELAKLNRTSFMFIGALLNRFSQVLVPLPGGCSIGKRSIDYHLAFLQSLGAEIEQSNAYFLVKSEKLKGNKIKLPYPSTTTTEHILISSVLAKGITIIKNAAKTPETLELVEVLHKMGADIESNNDEFTIRGVNELRGFQHKIMPDRNEAVTLVTASLVCGGNVTIENFPLQNHMNSLFVLLDQIGAKYKLENSSIYLSNDINQYKMVSIESGPFPDFETDWIPLGLILLNNCIGKGFLHEIVFEDRLRFVHQLIKMGANINLSKKCLANSNCSFGDEYAHTAEVLGPSYLTGGNLTVEELRGGAALVIAALSANGETQIKNSDILDRGYENLFHKFKMLGADIHTKHGA